VALAEYERPNPRRGNNFPGVARHGKRFLSTLSIRARTTGDVNIGTPLSDVCGFETRISLASPQRSLEFQPYTEALATVKFDSGGTLPKINNVRLKTRYFASIKGGMRAGRPLRDENSGSPCPCQPAISTPSQKNAFSGSDFVTRQIRWCV